MRVWGDTSEQRAASGLDETCATLGMDSRWRNSGGEWMQKVGGL